MKTTYIIIAKVSSQRRAAYLTVKARDSREAAVKARAKGAYKIQAICRV